VLSDFFEQVKQIELEMGSVQFWYRGHSNTEYKLQPIIFRDLDGKNETSLFYEHKLLSATINNGKKTNWELLFDMQHYGIPTRLLDWTSRLGVALFFAVRNNPISPCIWILAPYKLNAITINQHIIVDVSVIDDCPPDDKIDFGVHCIISKETKVNNPFAILAPHGNNRISAQRGMFTIHGNFKEPIEDLCPDAVRKINIPKDLAEVVKTHLETLGIDDFSLFPDHEGLKNYLNKKYTP
jgi:FRG domain